MPDPVSVGLAVGVATGAAAIAQSRLQAARDAKAAERDASTISGILKEMSLTTSRVRQGTSAAYGRLASGSTPRHATTSASAASESRSRLIRETPVATLYASFELARRT